MNAPGILFVDDEPHILDGLRRSLRAKRNEWDMSFAAGGEPALEILAGRRATSSCLTCVCLVWMGRSC